MSKIEFDLFVSADHLTIDKVDTLCAGFSFRRKLGSTGCRKWFGGLGRFSFLSLLIVSHL